MLFFLTGDIQIGKTRWLASVIDELEGQFVEPCGVIAPGVWVERDIERGDGKPGFANESKARFEKLGIDNELLPGRERIQFARRKDLACAAGMYDEASQSARANLQWAIDDAGIARVNGHFERLAQIDAPARRLLVVDELGRLELMCGDGLTSAVRLIDRGASPAFPHALAVVRSQLLETALNRFTNASWNGVCAIEPNDESARMLLGMFDRK